MVLFDNNFLMKYLCNMFNIKGNFIIMYKGYVEVL